MRLTQIPQQIHDLATLSVLPRSTDRAAEARECLGQGRSPAVDLSSFRTYLARLSAVYGCLRSGENDSFSRKPAPFPYGAGFPPSASDKQAPGSPPTGRRSLGRSRLSERDSHHDTLVEEEGYDPPAPNRRPRFLRLPIRPFSHSPSESERLLCEEEPKVQIPLPPAPNLLREFCSAIAGED